MRDNKNFDIEKNVLATKQDILDTLILMQNQKSDIIKWMFIFWIGQIAVTLGIVYCRG
jgi:hypothetical protein